MPLAQETQQYAAQNLKSSIKINKRDHDPRSKHTRSCDQLRQALEASPGVTMAMAYGFVPSYRTTEHIMNNWYKEQRLAQATEHDKQPSKVFTIITHTNTLLLLCIL